jgi:tetratricopeptide (TPR) repeat protein
MRLSWHVLQCSPCWMLAFGLTLALAEPPPAPGTSPAAGLRSDMPAAPPLDQVAAWIQELGAGDYARRERAQARLRRLGLEVFDQLYDAQSSDDIEIALRARYLIGSLTIRWAQDEDPPAVRELLRAYHEQGEEDRGNLVKQLVELPENQGLEAACRIVRFETSNLLSKRTALLIMQKRADPNAADAPTVADRVAKSVGTSSREAAHWLRVYVATLRRPTATLAEWEAISTQEEQTFSNTADRSAVDIVRDLLRWRADLLERIGRSEESLALILKTFDLLDGTQQQLNDAVDWLLQRQRWGAVIEIASRFPQRFQESAGLLYRLAEAQSQQGLEDQAEKTAELALNANLEDHREHILAAYALQERGLLEWSEREYRGLMQRVSPGSPEGLQVRLFFSELLHDLQRNEEAAEVLRDLVQAMEKDQNVKYLVARFRRDPGSIASRMHYFLAEHARSKGDSKKSVENLKKAIQYDAADADVLIGMYRASADDPVWRKETLNLIAEAIRVFRDEANDFETQVAEAPNEEIRGIYRRELAAACNQLAWLLSNTEGDYDEALRSSQRSLELRPETAGYLDTLGQCYYAKGDYENAVLHQSRAVELEPHSRQIRRQLEFFQKAWKTTQTKSQQ